MNSALIRNVVVRQKPAILQLPPRKHNPLLIRVDALLVLNLTLQVSHCAAQFRGQGHSPASQCLQVNADSGFLWLQRGGE